MVAIKSSGMIEARDVASFIVWMVSAHQRAMEHQHTSTQQWGGHERVHHEMDCNK